MVWVSFPLVAPAVCGEMLLQGHLLINYLGRISVSVSYPCLPPLLLSNKTEIAQGGWPSPASNICTKINSLLSQLHTYTGSAISPDLPGAVQGQISCDSELPCHLWPSRKFKDSKALAHYWNPITQTSSEGSKGLVALAWDSGQREIIK